MAHSGQPVVWVLVADGERARVVTPAPVEGRFVTVLPLGIAEHPHHAPVPRSEPHHGDKHQFGIEIARNLNFEAERNAYDRLVLVAPGHVLHAVRDALGKSAADRLVGTMSKDFTKLNDHDLSPHLAEWWLAPAEPAGE